MKRLFSSIRPPGAPTSIRPPKQGSYAAPKSGRVRRPARNRPPDRRPRASRGPHRSRRPGAVLVCLVVLLIVTALIAAGGALTDLVENLSRPRVATAPTRAVPTRTVPARRTPSPSPTPSDRPAHAGSWREAWSLDDTVLVGTSTSRRDTLLYTWGDYFVVAHRIRGDSSSEADVTGYRIGAAGAERAWTITMDDFTRPPSGSTPWGPELITGRQLVDITTGRVSDAPWEQHSSLKLVFNNIAIVCASSGDWCAGWDWNDGNPFERWRQGSTGRNWSFPTAQVVGDDATGYVRVEESPRSRRSRSTTSDSETSGFLSLADGSVHNSSSKSSSKSSRTTYVPAADGWLRQSRNRSGFEMLSPDGASVGAIEPGAANDEYRVLLSPTGLPTLDEYRRAYELGDTGWATTVLTSSRSGNPQYLNGQPLRDETPSTPHVPGVSEGGRALLSPDGRTLLVIRSSSYIPAVAVDLATSTTTELPSEVTNSDNTRVVVRADLVVVVAGTRIVGYSPAG